MSIKFRVGTHIKLCSENYRFKIVRFYNKRMFFIRSYIKIGFSFQIDNALFFHKYIRKNQLTGSIKQNSSPVGKSNRIILPALYSNQ